MEISEEKFAGVPWLPATIKMIRADVGDGLGSCYNLMVQRHRILPMILRKEREK